MRVVLGAPSSSRFCSPRDPLLVFSSAMRRAKLEGMLAFQCWLAERYSRDFDPQVCSPGCMPIRRP